VGEALDALTSQLSAEETAMPVIVQQFLPDQFFSSAQRERLSGLMTRWREARETGNALQATEQTELERLVDEEVQGTAERATHILHDLEAARIRRPSKVALAEFEAMSAALREQQSQRALLFYSNLAASILGGVMVIIAFVLIFEGSRSRVIGILIFMAGLEALQIFFSWREVAARKRVESLSLQAEAYRHPGEPPAISESLESSADPGKSREQTEAR
jgi:hypothetical protein